MMSPHLHQAQQPTGAPPFLNCCRSSPPSSPSSKERSLGLKSILVHATWVSFVGLLLLRIGTTDTYSEFEAQIFIIAGVAIASVPWLLVFLASAAATLFLELGICDFTLIIGGSGRGAPVRDEQQQDRDREGEYNGDEKQADEGGGGGGSAEASSSSALQLEASTSSSVLPAVGEASKSNPTSELSEA